MRESYRHLWFGGGSNEEHYHRKLLLRIYWDEESSPSVDVPLGDFFGVGHAAAGRLFYSLPLSMYVADSATRPTRNCWFPMPFSRGAQFELVNDGERGYSHYFYVDYEEHPSIPGRISGASTRSGGAKSTTAEPPPGDGSEIGT